MFVYHKHFPDWVKKTKMMTCMLVRALFFCLAVKTYMAEVKLCNRVIAELKQLRYECFMAILQRKLFGT